MHEGLVCAVIMITNNVFGMIFFLILLNPTLANSKCTKLDEEEVDASALLRMRNRSHDHRETCNGLFPQRLSIHNTVKLNEIPATSFVIEDMTLLNICVGHHSITYGAVGLA